MNYSGISKRIAALTVAAMLSTAAAFAAEASTGRADSQIRSPRGCLRDARQFSHGSEQYKTAKDGIYPSREGLDNLRQSGSSFFSKNEFKELLKHVPAKDLVVIDLRNESHGYINDDGISWYSRYKTFNKGQSAKEIDRREKSMLETAKMNQDVDVATLDKHKDIASQKVEHVKFGTDRKNSSSNRWASSTIVCRSWTTLHQPRKCR